MIITVSGTVHALEDIKHHSAYARATFNTLDNIMLSPEGRQLHFRYSKPFFAESVDSLLTQLITDHSNVDWNLEVSTPVN